ncbi:putative membrane protein [Nymphaea thermarum]|nr:putative membrane protein [Nymphaea thermarum]
MNDLSWRSRGLEDGREASFWSTIPRAATCTLLFLFALGVSVFAFVLFAVHNALFLLILLALSALLLALLFWNAWNWRRRALSSFLSRLPDSGLATAAEGHFVKVTGVATCGSVALESSYEKAARCVYTSTNLYEYGGLASLFNGGWSIWRYIEEGKRVCVMGVLKRSEDGIAIVEPPESIPTGCQWGRLLFPLEIDGLILSST